MTQIAKLETKGERTRSEVVESAYLLFLERGYHGTSMRKIAQRAGIALGSIYNHFASKDEIFEAVLLKHHPYLEIIPAILNAKGESIEELLRDSASQIIDGLGQHPDFLNLTFIELVEFNGQHIPQLFDLISPTILATSQRLVRWQDQLRPVPLPILMRAFFGLFFSYFFTDLLIGKQMPPALTTNALDEFVEIFLHGIMAKG